ncbi:protein apnoia isoform X2 [Leguminivora glycinivorella]|uniref:protein apnoia isoform X2 n=1 Tax=Leguminivora glycinivorella TaxID=1035111 RepID=UPI00200FB7B2|nr:protein apnoia isoform X2 [Leguminivora glycinivorella]
MCNKFTVLSLAYVAIFVSVVQCEEDTTNFTEILSNAEESVGRTFGHNALKRLSFIFLPVMFTLGVISTLLMALAVISVKNLAIGVMLLIVSVSQAVSRLFLSAAPSPLVHLHPRAELLPAPVAAPWGRSDNGATISD